MITTMFYTPEYSDLDRTLFKTFTKQLAEKFNSEIIQIGKVPLIAQDESKSKLRKIMKQIDPPQVRTEKLKISKPFYCPMKLYFGY